MRKRRIALALGTAAGALLVGTASLTAYLYFLSAPFCETEIKRVVSNVAETRVAIVYEKNCGATTPNNTQVAIVRSPVEFSENSSSVFSAHGQHDLVATWQSDSALEITLPVNETIYNQQSAFEGVVIKYR